MYTGRHSAVAGRAGLPAMPGASSGMAYQKHFEETNLKILSLERSRRPYLERYPSVTSNNSVDIL